MGLQVNALILPSEDKAHHHVEHIFIECLINISVKELLADQGKNFSMMSPVHILIFYILIFWIFWFHFYKMLTDRSDLKDNQNQREPIHTFQRWVLTNLQNITDADTLFLSFYIITACNTKWILTFAHSLLLNFIKSLNKVHRSEDPQHSRHRKILWRIVTIRETNSLRDVFFKQKVCVLDSWILLLQIFLYLLVAQFLKQFFRNVRSEHSPNIFNDLFMLEVFLLKRLLSER